MIKRILTSQKIQFLIVICLLMQILPASPTLACTITPTSQPAPTLAQRVNATDLVFIGTVTQVTEGNFEEVAQVEVSRYLKGTEGEIVTVNGFGPSSLCRRFVTEGEILIFYVQQRANGDLYAHWFTAGEAVMSVTDELVADILAIVDGTSLAPTFTPTPSQTPLTPDITITKTAIPEQITSNEVTPSQTPILATAVTPTPNAPTTPTRFPYGIIALSSLITLAAIWLIWKRIAPSG